MACYPGRVNRSERITPRVLTLFKWLLRAFALVALLAVGAIGLAYHFASGSLPDYNADYAVAGIEAPVEIVRDNYAIPHIFGGTDHDTLYGLGFVHAQDRLWQMTMLRRAAQGRLSELFGAETLATDELLRALGLYTYAVEAEKLQTPEVKAELQAYADGVNAWLRVVNEQALGRGAPEFFLFTKQIEPWTPADSIAVLKLMALDLTDAGRREVRRAKLALRLPPARLDDILPQAPKTVLDLPEFSWLREPSDHEIVTVEPDWNPLSPLKPLGLAGASNAFAADGSRTASGRPLLASDPHLALSAPSIWYLARLELDGGGAIGATIPGLPGVLVGRNTAIGWGLTASYLDDQDFYIEKLNPENPDEYLTPDGYAAFEITDTIIGIKGAPGVTRHLRRSRHGPVIPAPYFRLGPIIPSGHVAALSWTALSSEDRGIEMVLNMMRARSVDEARAVAPLLRAPALNLVVADGDMVAIQTMGRAPDRQRSHVGEGSIPAAGWLKGNDWLGLLPFEDNPVSVAPVGGIVVNTNNRVSDAPYPAHWTHDWGDTQRIVRAERLLNGREFHTLDSFIEIQTDIVSQPARTLLPLVGRDLWYTGAPAERGTHAERRQIALEALAAWNGEMSEHSFEPLVYVTWMRALHRRLVVDEIGALEGEFSRPDPLFLERVFRDIDGAATWCDVKPSTAIETCSEMASLALDDALIELEERFGPRIDAWRWGAAHQALHKHQVLGDIPVLQWIVNIVQDTAGGDFTLMAGLTPGRGPNPYQNVHGAAYRGVYDFSDPDNSVFIISTGQSGHPLSQHYDDLSLLWRRGEYITMSLDPAHARGGADGITMLTPK